MSLIMLQLHYLSFNYIIAPCNPVLNGLFYRFLSCFEQMHDDTDDADDKHLHLVTKNNF